MRRLLLLLLLSCLFGTPRAAWAAQLRVAVLEFDNASKDRELDALGVGLQSMFTTDLATLQTLQVVERARLKDVQAELALARGKGFDKQSAAKLGKLSGATHLFVGSYTVLGEQMRLDGRLLEVSSGKVLLAEQMAGEKALFFELEQKLVQKVIGALGVVVAPKEKAQLARPHTADFDALRKFSEGIKAFDDGRLEEAMRALSEAKTIDADFKLASLTLGEYERLAADVRAKAEVAGKVENELAVLEKNKALAAELAVTKKLWQLLERTTGQTPADKLKRVAILCVLSKHYGDELGFHSRGPVNAEDLAKAGFDKFSLERSADGLFKRAWSEGPEVFPKLPPICIGLHGPSSTSELPIEELLGYYIQDAQKISQDREVLLSYMSNSVHVDPAVARLTLDAPGELELWEQLYALAEKLPGLKDLERGRYEQKIAELRRNTGDFDGSTQMYAAASRHTQDSYELKSYAKEIDANKKLKQLIGTRPSALREYFLLNPSAYASDLERLAKAESKEELARKLAHGRDLDREYRGHYFLFSEYALWPLRGPSYCTLRSGPRATRYRASELHYARRPEREQKPRPEPPQILASALRASTGQLSVNVDQSPPPAGFDSNAPDMPGGAQAGVAFGLRRVYAEGGIVHGAPAVNVGYAVLLAGDKLKFVQIVRDGEHRTELKPLAEAKVSARQGKRALAVSIEPNQLKVTLDGESRSFAYKPAQGEADGFLGFIFSGVGHAAISDPRLTAGARR